MSTHGLLRDLRLISKILNDYGTPTYVYDLLLIREKIEDVKRALKDFDYSYRLYYSLKANNSPAIIDFLTGFHIGFETVSLGEVNYLLEKGIASESIMFTGCCLGKDELKEVVGKNIAVNLDSFNQLDNLIRMDVKQLEIGVRVNPYIGAGHHKYTVTGGYESKFGIPLNELPRFADKAVSHGLVLKRVHMHIGSGFMDYTPLLVAVERVLDYIKDIDTVTEFDIGGGYGISYTSDDEFNFPGFINKLQWIAREKLGDKEITFVFEPGRFLVARSGILLTRITEIKEINGMPIVGLDAGLSHFLRPALYGVNHRIVFPFSKTGRYRRGWIAGNICENSDVFSKEAMIPEDARIGDPVVILDAGAYGYTMASFYNMRSLPAEIIVDENGEIRVSRKRISPLEIPGF